MSQATTICDQKDLIANSGICAMVDGQQVALFYLPKETPQVYAIGNWDPIGKAHVLSRGMSVISMNVWLSHHLFTSSILTCRPANVWKTASTVCLYTRLNWPPTKFY